MNVTIPVLRLPAQVYLTFYPVEELEELVELPHPTVESLFLAISALLHSALTLPPLSQLIHVGTVRRTALVAAATSEVPGPRPTDSGRLGHRHLESLPVCRVSAVGCSHDFRSGAP